MDKLALRSNGVIDVRDLMNDIVTVVHKGGSKYEDIPASVQKGRIFIDDVTVPLSIGDRIERKLPSGQSEILVVTNVQLWTGNFGIADYYQIDYRREGVQEGQPATVVHVSDSPQTRVNLYSTDQSKNIINGQTEQVYSRIRELLTGALLDSHELEVLLERVDDMERNQGTDDFTRAYKDFLATAADHISILAPVLPALASLL